MKSLFIYKNVTQSDALESYANTKLEKVDKYLDADCEVTLTFELKGKENICTIGINGKRQYFKAKKHTDSMYDACAMSINNLKNTLSEDKQRRKSKWKRIKTYKDVAFEEDIDIDIEDILTDIE